MRHDDGIGGSNEVGRGIGEVDERVTSLVRRVRDRGSVPAAPSIATIVR
jgi:hypothetical protein